MMRVVVVEEVAEQVLEHFGRAKVASLEKAASQNAEPEFHLVQPRAMLGREMKDVFVDTLARISGFGSDSQGHLC